MSEYSFWENLSGLSVSNDKDECLKEWNVIYKSKKGSTDKNSGEELRCICGREINNFCIIINKFNNKHIKMGCECVKKLHGNNINNKIDTTTKSIKKNIIELFEKGGYYSQIENLDKYAEDIFIEYIMSKEDKIYYIHDIIDKYKENQYLYNIIEQILMHSIQLIKKKRKIEYMSDIINTYKDKKDLYKKIEKIFIDDIWKTPDHTIKRYYSLNSNDHYLESIVKSCNYINSNKNQVYDRIHKSEHSCCCTSRSICRCSS
jgi:hypothetical protein